MSQIQSLSELQKLLGGETVDRIFTEYFMNLIARSHVLDAVNDVVRKHGTLEEVEEVL